MSTLTLEAASVKANTITIKSATYSVEPIDPGFAGVAAVRLVKLVSGECYDVVLTDDGRVECDCPSFEFTYRGTAGKCKHGLAAVALGLLPAPVAGGAPVVALEPVKPVVEPITAKGRKRAKACGIRCPKGVGSTDTPVAKGIGTVDTPRPVAGEPAPVAEVAPMASDDESTGPMAWIKIGGPDSKVSVWANTTPDRVDYSERNARLDRIEAEARATNARIASELATMTTVVAAPVQAPTVRSTALRPADAREVRSWLDHNSRPVLERQERHERFEPSAEDMAAAALLFADRRGSCLAGESGPAVGDRSWPRKATPRYTGTGIRDEDVIRPGGWA